MYVSAKIISCNFWEYSLHFFIFNTKTGAFCLSNGLSGRCVLKFNNSPFFNILLYSIFVDGENLDILLYSIIVMFHVIRKEYIPKLRFLKVGNQTV